MRIPKKLLNVSPGFALAFSAAALAVVASITACSATTSGPGAHAVATSTAVKAGEKDASTYLQTCIPKGGVAQVNLARKLLTSGGRKNFSECLAIPKANRTAFEGALLTAAEKVKWSSKSQRDAFFTTTAPALAEHYRTVK